MLLPHQHSLENILGPNEFCKISLREKAWIKYKITQTDSEYLAYIKHRNEATKAVEESNCCYE